MFLLFLVNIAQSADCDFKEPALVSNKFADLSSKCRGLAQNFGFNTTDEFPNLSNFLETQDTKEVMPYIYGISGFVVPISVVSVLLILYFLIGQICACCPCCCPKTNKKVTLKSSICHILFSVLIFVAIALFFFSCSEITEGLKSTSKIPPAFNSAVDDVFDILETTVNDTVDLVTSTLDSALDNFQELIDYIDTTLTSAKTAATNAKNKLTDAKNNGAANIQSKGNTFDSTLESACPSAGDSLNDYKISSRTSGITDRIQEIINNVDKFNSDSQFNSLQGNLQNTLSSINTGISSHVTNFAEVTLPDLLTELRGKTDSFKNLTNKASGYLETAEKYSTLQFIQL